jgi:N6-adenosine-specific RNA methylase IME4
MLQFHPLANLFPLMEGPEFEAFVEDIRLHGVREPIVCYEDAILDGRNRYRAACEVGIECPRVQYQGEDPLGYVMSANLHRRHLDESQRAMIAAKLATTKHGGNRRTKKPIGPLIRATAASSLNVGQRSVTRAQHVLAHGTPELVRAVERGAVAVSVAAKVADLPASSQHQALAQPERAGHLVKKLRRTDREIALGKEQRAMPTKTYGVIYADPPWRFEPYDRESGMDRAADNHYPTMSLDDIKALKVPAADDAVLFLWATVPMLPQALELMAGWGFTYRSNFVWVKDRLITGYWTRNQHEHLLIGTRGDIPAPAPGEQYSSMQTAKLGEHSAKPATFGEMIKEMFPTLPRLEMFARGPRLGWDVWGNEA